MILWIEKIIIMQLIAVFTSWFLKWQEKGFDGQEIAMLEKILMTRMLFSRKCTLHLAHR